MSERPGPRISVNKLGEYMVATPARRRRIVMDQKRPREFVVARYRDAVAAMIDFLAGGASDDEIIYSAMTELENRPAASDFQQQDRDLSIEALESFLDTVDQLDLSALTVERGNVDAPHLDVGGVAVSVRPEVIARGTNGRREATVGCMKLYVGKSYPLNDMAGAYVGAVLCRFADEYLADNARADHRLCQTIDVFARRVFTAPRAVQRRHNDLEAAGQEIALLWDVV